MVCLRPFRPQIMEDIVEFVFFVPKTMENIGDAIQLVPQATSLRGADSGLPVHTSLRTSRSCSASSWSGSWPASATDRFYFVAPRATQITEDTEKVIVANPVPQFMHRGADCQQHRRPRLAILSTMPSTTLVISLTTPSTTLVISLTTPSTTPSTPLRSRRQRRRQRLRSRGAGCGHSSATVHGGWSP